MKIGLVRHFKVKHNFPDKTLLSKADVIKWFEDYDVAGVEFKEVYLNDINWKQCYSSPLDRALNTARHIYQGEVTTVTALRELDILHRLPNRMKLPFMVWGILVWINSILPNRHTSEFRNGIITFIDRQLSISQSDDTILIVSHWFVMRIIRKELLKRGLSGGKFKSDDYGVLYVFERLNL
jgi:hypothetical protein